MGDFRISQSASLAAYLVVEGINPANNYIEAVSLDRRGTKRIKPSPGFAIFGFTLAPHGPQLVYLEVGLKGGSSRQASWRLMRADLASGQVRLMLASGSGQGPADLGPIPFAWSARTGEIYFYSVRPFSGGWNQGVWAMPSDGSQLRLVLPPDKYCHLPQLSPDGARLAYLNTDAELLPQGYFPGLRTLPGNSLQVLDLVTSQETVIARAKEAAFGAFAWSHDGREIVVSQQEWRQEDFRDVAIIAVPADGSGQPEILVLPQPSSITDIKQCQDKALLWVNQAKEGAELMVKGAGLAAEKVLTLPQGRLSVAACLD